MAGLVYTLPDGKGTCSFVDQQGNPLSVEAAEISSTAARLSTNSTFSANEYIDMTLDLQACQQRVLCASHRQWRWRFVSALAAL